MKLCPNCNKSTINAMRKCPTCGNVLDESHIVSFGNALKSQIKSDQITQQEARQEEKERVAQMDKDGTAYCPKCYSTSLSAHKKGFGIGKAVVGAALTTNPLGLVAGNIGAKKVRVTCLKCGHQFWPGKK